MAQQRQMDSTGGPGCPDSPEASYSLQNSSLQDEDCPQKVIEDGNDVYRPGDFHPVCIGDVYNDRYKILNKIGYGSYSTVCAESYGTEHDIFEKEILTHLRNGDRDLLGYNHIAHLVDDFEHEGPNGKHVCLVFQVYGELSEVSVPSLDYAHYYGIIHTDIQPSNIFVKFRDYSLIESAYLQKRPAIPSHPLHNSYFNESHNILEFDVDLGDWSVASFADRHLTENIQPVALRAPEVLIKAPWDTKTDFWNLGAVILELYRTVRMFSGQVEPDGHYEVSEHLVEIVDLFGLFSKALLERGNQEIVRGIFDEEGKVKDMPPMGRPPLDSEAFVPGLDQDAREGFVSFLRAMMKIDPAEWLTAEDYLRHPWLGALR
ncbi:serine/threonine protein kinase [Xylaria acuta]|nr:serine/threonine protein kinase [Xylaria acuta]